MEDRLKRLKVDPSVSKIDSNTASCEVVYDLMPGDFNWLLEQADKLQKLADCWVAIETNGTVEDANNFYSYFQDLMTEKQ